MNFTPKNNCNTITFFTVSIISVSFTNFLEIEHKSALPPLHLGDGRYKV